MSPHPDDRAPSAALMAAIEPKPAHLGPEYGSQFEASSVARAYATRPPYPAALFDALEALLPDGPRVVLDLGCGTGEVAIGLAPRVQRLDAIDPSAAMLAVALEREGADHPSLDWSCVRAEDFALRGPYGLVVAAESLHWMDWPVVLPRIGAALQDVGVLALVHGRELRSLPWEDQLGPVIRTWSTNRDFRPYDLVEELTRRGLLRTLGRRSLPSTPFEQSVDAYIESFHTRNGFSRERMTTEAALGFDAAVRELVTPFCVDGRVRGEIRTELVWGRPIVVSASA